MVVVLGPSTDEASTAIAIANIPAQAASHRGVRAVAAGHLYMPSTGISAVATHASRRAHHPAQYPSHPSLSSPGAVLFGNAIIIEASLSFLGLGTPPPTPSWGGMLSGAGRQFMERVPTLALFPGLAISIAVLAFNLFGDMLRDILDPRLRNGSA